MVTLKIKEFLFMYKISIAISIHNRHETAEKTISEWKKMLPKGAKLFIVDDGSEIPFVSANIRNEKALGIAACKNQCLSLCDDADFIFLADDDIYPITKNWYKPYIESGEKHLCLTFDKFSNNKPNGRIKLSTVNGISEYKEPCGVLLFMTNEVIKSVGGMDESYGRWGYEHLNFSMRIHNQGFTRKPFLDIENSIDLFYSYDHQQTIKRSVDDKTRMKLSRINENKYRSDIKSKRFIPYKPENNLVLTCYFTTLIDPQRGHKWEYQPEILDTLINSVQEDVDFRCLSDHSSLHELPMVSYVPKHENPYLAKWIAFRDYIVAHPEYDNIAMLDGSDTEIMVNPFDYIDRDKIYCGDEPGFTNNAWLKQHHNIPLLNELYKLGRLPLLNAGVLIGNRDILLEFVGYMVKLINTNQNVLTEMLYFNYILRKYFSDRLVHGRKVTTVFKAFDSLNKNKSFIKHK